MGQGGIDGQFGLIRPRQFQTMHLHSLQPSSYPCQGVIDWLVKIGWYGWTFLEVSGKVPDRL